MRPEKGGKEVRVAFPRWRRTRQRVGVTRLRKATLPPFFSSSPNCGVPDPARSKSAGVHWLRGEPRQCGDRAHRLIPPSLAPTGERRPSMACLRPIPAPPRLSPSGCPWLRRRRLRHAAPKLGTPHREGRRCKGISSERYMDVPRPRVGAGRGTTRRTKSPCSGGPARSEAFALAAAAPARSGCCCPCSGSPTRSRCSRFRIAEPDLVTPRYSAAKAVEW